MKKILLTLLTVAVVVGALAGAGYAGYRVGYVQGATSSGDVPFFDRAERMHPNLAPNFGRDFGFRSQPFHSPMMGRGGFNFFSPFRLLWNVAVLVLIGWFVYWLFAKSGWRVTRELKENKEIPPAGTDG